MKFDPGSNAVFTLVDAHASLADAASRQTTAVPHANQIGVEYAINVSSVGTGGVLTWTLQYLASDGVTWTNEPDTTAGNDTTGTISAVGLTQVSCPQPRGSQTRLNLSAATDAVVCSTIAVGQPQRNIEP